MSICSGDGKNQKTEDRRQRTEVRGQTTDVRGQKTDDRCQSTDDRILNSEVGPVVVPKERDYAAARMRKLELKEENRILNSEVGIERRGQNIDFGSWNAECGNIQV